MTRIIIKPGQTWAYLAYKFLGSSSKFREILDANPKYHELDNPKPGDVVFIPSSSTNPITNAKSLDSISRGVVSIQEEIYPWKSLTNYLERVATYHPFALTNIEECNGDSLEVATPPFIPDEETITDVTSNTGAVNFNLL